MADVGSKVSVLREKFLDKFSGNILDDTYDERDVDWVKEDDGFLRSVLKAFKCGGDVNKGVEMLHEILLFRKKWEINDIKDVNLNAELKEKDGVYFHGLDKSGHKFLQFRVCKQKKGYLLHESKRYILFMMNSHYRANPEEPIVTLFDFIDAGVGNMDMDISKFIIHLVASIFPGLTDYSLMFKMSPALEVIWKMLKVFMDSDQTKRTFFVNRTNINQYMDKDQLLPHQIKPEKK